MTLLLPTAIGLVALLYASVGHAGATGYISKGAPRAEIVDEVDRVLRGEPRRMSLVTPPTATWRPVAGRISSPWRAIRA